MRIYNLVKESFFLVRNGFESMVSANNSYLKINKLIFSKLLKYVGFLFIFIVSLNQATAETKTTVTAAPWGSGTTWNPVGVPAAGDDVILNHKVTVDANFTCASLTINAAGRLSIQPGYYFTISGALTFATGGVIELFSDVNYSGSLIFNSLTAANTSSLYFERYMTGTNGGAKKWHTFAAPMTNSTTANFFQETIIGNKDKVEVSTNGLYYSFGGNYNESTNKWEYLFPSDDSNNAANFIAGKGYGVAMKADGSVKMSGRLATSPVTVPITFSTGTVPAGGFGWNSLGNPFTSVIRVSDYITANSSQLDPTYGGLYIWNPAGYYEVTSLGGGLTYLQVGQGFVTRSKAGGGTISFTYAMRWHWGDAPFKAAPLAWPGIELKVATTDMSRTTLVNFNSNMTVGVDPFYDAGLLRSGGGLELYSRLITENGTDYAIQCLPDAGFDKMVVPLSLDFVPGGEVTFSAKSINLPAECQPVLEDRLLGITTQLNTSNASYKVTLPANTAGIKRFYLHLNGIASVIPNNNVPDLNAYAVGREIHIQGSVASQAVADLYDLSGRRVATFRLQASDNNILQPDGVFGGFYLLRIMEGNKPKFVGKIRIQ